MELWVLQAGCILSQRIFLLEQIGEERESHLRELYRFVAALFVLVRIEVSKLMGARCDGGVV